MNEKPAHTRTILGRALMVITPLAVLAFIGAYMNDVPAASAQTNFPATGKPTIVGTERVTQELWAYIEQIQDDDGLENVVFSYQWVSNDGSTDTDILGATSYGYTLQSTDEGKSIKVRVTFTDDAGNPESATSEATAEIVAEDAGICGRTPVVRDRIVQNSPVGDCGFVTDDHLAGNIGWHSFHGDLSNQIPPAPRIDSLKAGDFAGLSNLYRLTIRKTRIAELPTGVFNGLSGLRELVIYQNPHLSTVQSGAFDGLTLLTDLSMYRNAISALPTGAFDDMLVLESLDLRFNEFTSLPSGLLDNQTNLEELKLDRNELTDLPDGIFDNLTGL